MRITTQMINDTAQKTGMPIHRNSLVDVLRSGDSSGGLLASLHGDSVTDALTSSQIGYTADSMEEKAAKKLFSSANSLQECAAKLADRGEDSLFAKAEESQDTLELVSEVTGMAEAYNETLERLRSAGGALNEFYRGELANLVGKNAEALKAVGVTQNKNGSLSVDQDVLASADLKSLKTALGTDFLERLGYVGARVSDNAQAGANSLSGRYEADGTSSYGVPCQSRCDFWG